MSAHNICFHGEIRKILYGYPILSGTIVYVSKNPFLMDRLVYTTNLLSNLSRSGSFFNISVTSATTS